MIQIRTKNAGLLFGASCIYLQVTLLLWCLHTTATEVGVGDFIYTQPIGCSCFTVSVIKTNKINWVFFHRRTGHFFCGGG